MNDGVTSHVKCTVIGTGFLGTRIIGELSRFGFKVKGYDSNPTVLAKVSRQLDVERLELIKRKLCDENTKFHFELCDNLVEAVNDADFIFEAIYDDLDAKKTLYQKITNICKSNTIICSNTLHLNIDDITEDALFKERILGCRFMAPVYCIPLVEFTVPSITSSETKITIERFFHQLNYRIIHRQHGTKPKKLFEPEIINFWTIRSKKLREQQVEVKHFVAQETDHDFSKANILLHTSSNTKSHAHGTKILDNEADNVMCQSGHGSSVVYQPPPSKALQAVDETIYKHNIQTKAGHITMTDKTEQKDNIDQLIESHNEQTDAGHVTMIERTTDEGMMAPNSCECVICQEASIDTVLLPCSHMWFCFKCANLLKENKKPCPACRHEIQSILQVYKP